MTALDSRFITPPKEEEEIYPYRRVWSSIIFETASLIGLVLIIFIVTRFVEVPLNLRQPIGIAVTLAPVGLWFIGSWSRERMVPQPRPRLIAIGVISALAANAVGIPLVENFLQVDRWLPLENAVNRIIGYTFTQGLVQAIITYFIIRHTAWPSSFRIRLDAVAYGAVSAVGYATVLNLHLVVSNTPSPDITAFRVFDTLALQLATNIIIGYGLSEVRFNRHPFSFLLSASVILAAFITGMTIPLRAGLTNAILAQGVSTVSPIRGFLFSILVLVSVSIIFAFLFNNAERQDSDAVVQREI